LSICDIGASVVHAGVAQPGGPEPQPHSVFGVLALESEPVDPGL
jgi:hypothetical protein